MHWDKYAPEQKGAYDLRLLDSPEGRQRVFAHALESLIEQGNALKESFNEAVAPRPGSSHSPEVGTGPRGSLHPRA